MEERDLLEQLVQSLSSLNGSDQLGGYLNSLAVEYNLRMEAMGLPTIQYCKKYDIKVTYDQDENNLAITDATSGSLILVIEDANDKLEPLDLICDTTLLSYIEEYYTDELEEHFS